MAGSRRLGRRRTLAILLLTTLLGVLAWWSSVAHAASTPLAITVNTTADTSSGSGTGGCLDSPETTCSLREAITAAESSTAVSDDGAVITIPADTYTLSNGVLTVAAPSGDPITLDGAAQSSTLISANDLSQVMDLTTGTVTVENLTLEHGSATTDGGCLDIAAPVAGTLQSVTVQGCTTSANGGGVSVEGSLGPDTDTLSFLDDTAPLGDGGGLYDDQSASAPGTVEVGGAQINDDSAENGGGIADADDASTGVGLRVVGSTLSDDSATVDGGGLYVDGRSFEDTAPGLLVTTVSGDAAGTAGGGIYATSATPLLSNATIAANTAPTGADVTTTVSSGIGLEDTLISNGAGEMASANCSILTMADGFLDQGNNLDSGDSCGLDAAGDLVNTNPDLGPLADNGGIENDQAGPPETMALDVGSPAIGAGTPTGCPAVIDERGAYEPTPCSIGAYEPLAPIFTTPSAGGLTQTTATVSDSVTNPDFVPVSASVQYGTSPGSYPDTVPASEQINVAPGQQTSATVPPATAVSFGLSGLAPGTTYYYEVTATNARGTLTSSQGSFTTSAAPSTTTTATSTTPTTPTTPTSTTPTPTVTPSNTFKAASLTGSTKTGTVTEKLTAPDAGSFSATATYTVTTKVTVKKKGKKVVEKKPTTYTYGSATLKVTAAGTKTLSLKESTATKREVAKLKLTALKLKITTTFTPVGGKRATKTATLTVHFPKPKR